MRFPWHSVRARPEGGAGVDTGASYESDAVVESQALPGVKLRIVRMSFGGRWI